MLNISTLSYTELTILYNVAASVIFPITTLYTKLSLSQVKVLQDVNNSSMGKGNG